VADVAPDLKEPKGKEPIPTEIEARLKRGRDGLSEVVARRQLGIKFANGQHFAEINEDGSKVVDISTATVALGGTKDDHRVRRSHDIVSPKDLLGDAARARMGIDGGGKRHVRLRGRQDRDEACPRRL
jgi:hypothetical protein